MPISLTVNGNQRSFDGDPTTPLLWYLRDELAAHRDEISDAAAGLCGSCTVHRDGQAIRSCQTPMSTLAGRQIVTIEGLSADGSHPVQQAWMQANVPQCGYCQIGPNHAGRGVPQEHAQTDRSADIDRAMSGNICRCGTYQRIRAAIKSARRGRHEGGAG